MCRLRCTIWRCMMTARQAAPVSSLYPPACTVSNIQQPSPASLLTSALTAQHCLPLHQAPHCTLLDLHHIHLKPCLRLRKPARLCPKYSDYSGRFQTMLTACRAWGWQGEQGRTCRERCSMQSKPSRQSNSSNLVRCISSCLARYLNRSLLSCLSSSLKRCQASAA